MIKDATPLLYPLGFVSMHRGRAARQRVAAADVPATRVVVRAHGRATKAWSSVLWWKTRARAVTGKCPASSASGTSCPVAGAVLVLCWCWCHCSSLVPASNTVFWPAPQRHRPPDKHLCVHVPALVYQHWLGVLLALASSV